MVVNFEFGAEFEIIGFDFNGRIGYRNEDVQIIVDARNEKRKSTLKKVLTGLDSAIGSDEVSSAIISVLEFIGIDPDSDIVLHAYFYYNKQDGARYSFEIAIEAPKSDSFKFFAITRLSMAVANFEPPPNNTVSDLIHR